MASCPATDPRSRKFVAPPRPQQSEQPSKRPVYGNKKLLEAKQAKKAARKAARQTPSCDMVATDPAPLYSSPADDMTSGAAPQPAHEAVFARLAPVSDTPAIKPALWQPVTTSPITAPEFSKLPPRTMSLTEATVLRAFPIPSTPVPSTASPGFPEVTTPAAAAGAVTINTLLAAPIKQPSPSAADTPTTPKTPMAHVPASTGRTTSPDNNAPRMLLWQRVLERSFEELLHVVLAVPIFIYVVATA